MRYRLKLATWTVIREPGQPSPRILRDPEATVLLAKDIVRDIDDDKEHFWVILLNAKNHYLMHTLVSTGTQTCSLVGPLEVFGPALREGAASIILLHNHPSSDPSPSKEDLSLTRRLSDAAKILDIRLLDHLILGNGSGKWVSLAKEGIL